MIGITEPMLIFMIGQSIIIIGAVGLAYIRTQILIAQLKVEIGAIGIAMQSIKEDQKSVEVKVEGISRHVALIEGMELEKQRQLQRNNKNG